MPTYDYECQACGHRFDVLQKITEEPLKKCPHCGKPRLKRLIGAGLGVIFKGSGFYTTDYKRSGANGSSSRKGESKSEAPPSAGGKTESKGEGKGSSSDSKSKAESKTA